MIMIKNNNLYFFENDFFNELTLCKRNVFKTLRVFEIMSVFDKRNHSV